MNLTKSTKKNQLERKWHLVDAKDQVLGRFASGVALLLMGKKKTYFVRNLDCGDFVVVINAGLIKVTGKKAEKKFYRRHSGFPGGFKEEALGKLLQRKPTDIVRFAVSGMLPKNKLRDRMLARLYIYAGENHDYSDKFNK